MAQLVPPSGHPILNLTIIKWEAMEDYFAGLIESWEEHPGRKSGTPFPFFICFVWHSSASDPFVIVHEAEIGDLRPRVRGFLQAKFKKDLRFYATMLPEALGRNTYDLNGRYFSVFLKVEHTLSGERRKELLAFLNSEYKAAAEDLGSAMSTRYDILVHMLQKHNFPMKFCGDFDLQGEHAFRSRRSTRRGEETTEEDSEGGFSRLMTKSQAELQEDDYEESIQELFQLNQKYVNKSSKSNHQGKKANKAAKSKGDKSKSKGASFIATANAAMATASKSSASSSSQVKRCKGSELNTAGGVSPPEHMLTSPTMTSPNQKRPALHNILNENAKASTSTSPGSRRWSLPASAPHMSRSDKLEGDEEEDDKEEEEEDKENNTSGLGGGGKKKGYSYNFRDYLAASEKETSDDTMTNIVNNSMDAAVVVPVMDVAGDKHSVPFDSTLGLGLVTSSTGSPLPTADDFMRSYLHSFAFLGPDPYMTDHLTAKPTSKARMATETTSFMLAAQKAANTNLLSNVRLHAESAARDTRTQGLLGKLLQAINGLTDVVKKQGDEMKAQTKYIKKLEEAMEKSNKCHEEVLQEQREIYSYLHERQMLPDLNRDHVGLPWNSLAEIEKAHKAMVARDAKAKLVIQNEVRSGTMRLPDNLAADLEEAVTSWSKELMPRLFTDRLLCSLYHPCRGGRDGGRDKMPGWLHKELGEAAKEKMKPSAAYQKDVKDPKFEFPMWRVHKAIQHGIRKNRNRLVRQGYHVAGRSNSASKALLPIGAYISSHKKDKQSRRNKVLAQVTGGSSSPAHDRREEPQQQQPLQEEEEEEEEEKEVEEEEEEEEEEDGDNADESDEDADEEEERPRQKRKAEGLEGNGGKHPRLTQQEAPGEEEELDLGLDIGDMSQEMELAAQLMQMEYAGTE